MGPRFSNGMGCAVGGDGGSVVHDASPRQSTPYGVSHRSWARAIAMAMDEPLLTVANRVIAVADPAIVALCVQHCPTAASASRELDRRDQPWARARE
jgi:hypothetical protein